MPNKIHKKKGLILKFNDQGCIFFQGKGRLRKCLRVNSEASTGVYTFLKMELFKKMKEMNKMKMGKG